MLLAIYRFLGVLFTPFVLLLLLYRALRGKEELFRLSEKFGFASKINNQPLFWLHAASIGESLTAIALISKLSSLYPQHHFLLTTVTRTSAKLVAAKNIPRLTHQYLPMDISFFISRFLKHWRPQIAIFIESEIWPNLIIYTSKTCPLILANGIISAKSVKKWLIFKNTALYLMQKFSQILAQDKINKDRFISLGGKNVIEAGNLKFLSKKLDFNQQDFSSLQSAIAGRPVLLAASTHQGDEQYMLECLLALRTKWPNLLLIIAPRHLDRVKEIEKIMLSASMQYSIRSLSQHINDNTQIYIADTIGELGLLYSLADISFIGGSLNHGGHNILEPSFFNTLILFGPNMSNFASIAEQYLEQKGAIMCPNMQITIDTIDLALGNPKIIAQYTLTALEIVQNTATIEENYLHNITQIINNAQKNLS